MFIISVVNKNNEDASANGPVVWDLIQELWGEGADLTGGWDAVLWTHQGLGRRGNGENKVDTDVLIKDSKKFIARKEMNISLSNIRRK